MRVRPVRPDDAPAIERFLEGLSDRDLYFRFFGGGVDLANAARRMSEVDDGLGLVATTGDEAEVIGHGLYIGDGRPNGTREAEVAFTVAEAWQGHGLATTMLVELAEAAAAAGIEVFTATVLPENHKMTAVFRKSGFPVEVHPLPGELEVKFPTLPTDEGRRRFDARERDASVAAVSYVMRPRSVAVVGASRRRGTVGGELLHNLVEGRFAGRLVAINPAATEIEGVPCFPALRDVPHDVDLAVIAVPAGRVLDAAHAAAAKGVRALVVLTAGFSEVGEAGVDRQRELLRICRTAGMRMVGPNCLGVLNTDASVSMDATFSPGSPPRGRVGFASQSGGFGIAAIDLARDRGIGLSSFASLGDKADLSGNDFLQFWEVDPGTDAMMLYLESFGNPRKFGRIARRITATKPIIAVKGGRTSAGRRAASSHTGALLAAADTSVDALFEHAGVIRTETVAEMFDVAAVLAHQPLPPGNRIAIVTNVGGPGILCADACDTHGLTVAELSEDTQDRLRAHLPAEASVTDPVDLVASATAADYRHAVATVLGDEGVDGAITIFARPLGTRAADVQAAIAEAVGQAHAAKPVLTVFLGRDVPPPPAPDGPGLPVFTAVEEAARALGHAALHAAHRRAPAESLDPPPDIDDDRASAIVAAAMARGPGWLAAGEVETLLDCYGVPLAPSRIAATPHRVRRAAAELGGAVAVKALAEGVLHKSEAGAVRTGVRSPTAAAAAAREMRDRLHAAGHPVQGFLVQQMAKAGTELIVGVVADPEFGPLVAVGAGGTMAELLGDIEVRLAPVGARTAADMLRGLRTFPLLDGYRGAAPADVPAVEDVIVRIAALAATHPEVAELDCNPVIAGPDGAVVVDARIRLEPPPGVRPFGAVDR